MINRMLVAVALLTVFGTAVMAQGTAATTQGPKLEVVGGETYDWGKVKPPADGNLQAEIKMKNVGTGDLKIVEVKPGCGCTKTDPDKMELVPGDVSTMGVKLNISPAQAGPVTKSITIRWGDAKGLAAREEFRRRGTPIPAGLDTNEQVAFLFLKADIQRALMMTPSIYFSFQDLKIGQKSTATVTITNNTDAPVDLTEWTADNGLILNAVGKVTIKPHEKFDLTATLVPAVKGQFSGMVMCKTNHPDHPDLTIRAYGFTQESESPVFQKAK